MRPLDPSIFVRLRLTTEGLTVEALPNHLSYQGGTALGGGYTVAFDEPVNGLPVNPRSLSRL